MLLQSKNPIKTLKSIPSISDNRSTWLLLQAGYIRQEIAWAFNFLPMWLKTIKNIENIIKKHVELSWSQEIYMTCLWSKETWMKTWRWDSVDVLYKVLSGKDNMLPLNLTHEESVTPLVNDFIRSYKDLPFSLYQNQTKFRNEKRAKSGLLRWREFLMHDQYSFHIDEQDLNVFYNEMSKRYKDIFNELWLGDRTYRTYASGGDYSSNHSHEFQTLLDIGEDTIHICKNCKVAFNKEIVKDDTNFSCLECWWKDFDIQKASEAWNIFKLLTNFSEKLNLNYTDKNWKRQPVYMWSYWIWISRSMGIIAESFMDEKWLVWPENIAPYKIYIIWMDWNQDKAKEFAEKLEKTGNSVILDDRDIWFWSKAKDAEILWIPNRIVISEKSLANWWYEFKKRDSDRIEILTENDCLNSLNSKKQIGR